MQKIFTIYKGKVSIIKHKQNIIQDDTFYDIYKIALKIYIKYEY
jgi:hypothetical protein